MLYIVEGAPQFLHPRSAVIIKESLSAVELTFLGRAVIWKEISGAIGAVPDPVFFVNLSPFSTV